MIGFMERYELSTNEAGTLAEMLVSVDLMKRGWLVFRSIDGKAPYDLIATLRGGGNLAPIVRIEVKAHRTGSPDWIKFDVLARVDPDETITYQPAIEEWVP